MYIVKIQTRHPRWAINDKRISYYVGGDRWGSKRFAVKFTSLSNALKVLRSVQEGEFGGIIYTCPEIEDI
jgi:hypothetical protein